MLVLKILGVIVLMVLSFLNLVLNALVESVLDGISFFSESYSTRARNRLERLLWRLGGSVCFCTCRDYLVLFKCKVKSL